MKLFDHIHLHERCWYLGIWYCDLLGEEEINE